jgi:uncharacterized protein
VTDSEIQRRSELAHIDRSAQDDTEGRSSVASAWYADGLRFACTQCGACCSGAPGYVWVDGDEIDAIAAQLGLTAEQVNLRYVRRVGRGRSLLEKPGGDCIFLERRPAGSTGCQIHAVRPTQCRTWPFWKSNLASAEAWRQAARGCPGIGRERTHALATILAALRDNGTRPL